MHRRCLEPFDRQGMMTFQERTFSQTGKVTFHTHMHLSNTDGRWESKRDIEEFVRSSGANIEKLLKTTSEDIKGVAAKPWRQADGSLLWCVEAHIQDDPTCHVVGAGRPKLDPLRRARTLGRGLVANGSILLV